MKLDNLSLKSKLRISFISFIIFSMIATISAFTFILIANKYKALIDDVQRFIVDVQKIREAEQNFIQYDRKEVNFLESGNSVHQKIVLQLLDSLKIFSERLSTNKNFADLSTASSLLLVDNYLSQYRSSFLKLSDAYIERGFYNHGLEVEMRSYVHDLQELPSDEEKVFAYKLRRNEKDFMLRNDEKYVEEFKKNILAFKNLINNAGYAHMTPTYREQTLKKIQTYEALFLRLVQLDKKIGLTETSGLKGELKKNLDSVFPLLNNINTELKTFYNRYIDRVYMSLFIGTVLLTTLGLVFIIIFPRIITRSVQLLDNVMTDVTAGNYARIADLRLLNNQDEIGRLAVNFTHLITTIQKQLGEIEEKNEFLEIKASEDARRNWINEGLASVTGLLNIQKEISIVLDLVLNKILKYTSGNQGAVYIVQKEQDVEYLVLKACYAYNRKKYLNQKILPGEGLAGTAWLEKEVIQLTEIPRDYFRITSGLGEAPPSYLIIIPLIYNDMVQGIFELAYFRKLENFEINYLKAVSERVAAAISNHRNQETTSKLLLSAQLMTEQLRAQEEEMRQNMEELQATQEELERKIRVYNEKIDHLSEEIGLLDQWNHYKNGQFIITDCNGNVRYVSRKILKESGIMPSQAVSVLKVEEILPSAVLKPNSNFKDGFLNTLNGRRRVMFRCITFNSYPSFYFFELTEVNEAIEAV